MKHPKTFPKIKQNLIHILSLIFLIFLFQQTSTAQPRIVWDSTYGGSGSEYGHDFARIPGGFIAVSKCTSNNFNVSAATDPDGSGNHSMGAIATQDFWIQKLNDNGQIIWQNSLGGDGAEEATCVTPTSDGGYILAGFIGGVFGTISATGDLAIPDADASGTRGGTADMWIVKLNSAGIMQWHNIVGGSGSDYANDIIQTSDGGYLVIGDSYSTDLDAAAANDVDGSGRHGALPNPDIWAIKLRPNGTIQWSNMLGGSTFDYGGSCIQVANGYLISGTSSSSNGDLALPDVDGTPAHGSYDYWVIKLDLNGNQVWDNAIGGSGTDCLYASPGIIATTDGNFVLVGRGGSTNGDEATALDVDGAGHHGGAADFFAVKINSSGNILWRNSIGTTGWDEIQSAYIACDGGIILSGHSDVVPVNGDKTRANPNNNRAPWMVKLNNAGIIEWDYVYASAGPGFDGPHHGLSYGMTKDYYVLTDSIGGDYFVLTSSQNPAGGDKTAPHKGSFDSWLLKFTFELTANYRSDVVCFGTPTQFTDQSTFTNLRPLPTYSWHFGDAASGALNTSTLKNPVHNFTAPGNYVVMQCVQYECKYDTMIKTINVPLPPDVSFTANYYVCNGSSISISPTVNPTGGSYSWSGGQTTSSISVSPVSNTTYSIVYTDITGCTNSAATTVTVNPVPVLGILSQNNVLCFGGSTGSATVNVISGLAPYTYSWNPSGQASALAVGLSAMTYTSTVTDGNGCSTTITATITEPPLLQPFIPASNDIICNGGTTGWALAGAIGGTVPYSYSWSSVPSQTTSTASNLTAGVYSVIITDDNNCTAQRSITLTEAPAITTTITVLSSPLCNGDATGSISIALSNGTAPFNYLWSPGNYTNSIVTGLTAGLYSVSINDINGCTAQSSINITEPTLLTMSPTSTPDHCLSGDGTASINPGGGTLNYTYSWSSSLQTTSTITGLSAGTYTATLTDNNGCSISAPMVVTPIAVDTLLNPSITNASCNGSCDGVATLQVSGSANGPYNYTWNTVPAQNSITATGLCTGSYVLTVSDASGCKDNISIFIAEPSPLTATLTSTSTLCFGDNTGTATVNVSGGTPGYIYNWQGGQASQTATGFLSGIYSVTITDNNGCTIAPTVQVNDSPQLIVTIAPSAPICDGQQTILNSNVGGGTPGYTYLWNTGQITSGITTPTLASNTSFSLLVTDNNGCTANAVTQVTVNALPIVNFSSDVTAGCKPLCVNFTNTSPMSHSQVWNFGDGGNSAQTNPLYCYNQTGSYSVTLIITDNNGCSNSLTQNNYITVHPDPVASFTATPQPATILNPTVFFRSNDVGVSGWYWSFGDALNSSSTDQNTNYTYSDTGNYTVRLVVVNEFGCRDIAEKTVRINPDFILYVPNSFTPNGDDINDLFTPIGIGVDVDEYVLYIYDRWGSQIFKSTQPNVGWDGKANDGKNVAQMDVYVWKVITRDVLGGLHRYEGHISLIK